MHFDWPILYLKRINANFLNDVIAGLDEIETRENLHFEFEAIRAATDNFATANKLGQGGFGVVYMV